MPGGGVIIRKMKNESHLSHSARFYWRNRLKSENLSIDGIVFMILFFSDAPDIYIFCATETKADLAPLYCYKYTNVFAKIAFIFMQANLASGYLPLLSDSASIRMTVGIKRA